MENNIPWRSTTPPNALHGGPEGFHRVVWTAEEAKGGDTASLKLKYVAKDMEKVILAT